MSNTSTLRGENAQLKRRVGILTTAVNVFLNLEEEEEQ